MLLGESYHARRRIKNIRSTHIVGIFAEIKILFFFFRCSSFKRFIIIFAYRYINLFTLNNESEQKTYKRKHRCRNRDEQSYI